MIDRAILEHVRRPTPFAVVRECLSIGSYQRIRSDPCERSNDKQQAFYFLRSINRNGHVHHKHRRFCSFLDLPHPHVQSILMAGPLLRILIRLKPNKYHRMQIAARYRIIDLFKQIAHDLHLTVDQLLHVSIYRNGPSGYALLYPASSTYSNTHYDVSTTLDKYGLSSTEELYIDLVELIHCQQPDTDDLSSGETLGASSSSGFEHFHLGSSTSVSLDSDKAPSSSSLMQAKTTNNLSSKKSVIGQLIRFAVPADNSCLFSSIYFVLHSGKLDLTHNKYLRNLVASKIESDHNAYSEAMLGRTNSEYSKWIRRGRHRSAR